MVNVSNIRTPEPVHWSTRIIVLCEEMGLNTPTTPPNYLTGVRLFSSVITHLTSCTSLENSLSHSIHFFLSPHRISCAPFSTSEFWQGNDCTASGWIRWVDICMPRSFWSVFHLLSHLHCFTFLGNMTAKLGNLPPTTARSGWGCFHVLVCSHLSLFLLVGQSALIQQPPYAICLIFIY